MVKVSVPRGGDWRTRFRAFEMRFLDIHEAAWPQAFFQQIKDILPTYSAQKHAIHVDLLNGQFKLSPALETDDFAKSWTLREVQDEAVAPRLPLGELEMRVIDIAQSEEELREADLGHLILRDKQ